MLLGQDSFRTQQTSLRELTLCSYSSTVRVANIGWIDLPAMQVLTVQNLGLTDLHWLSADQSSPALAAVHSLDVDGTRALQLDSASVEALLNMSALTKVSMRKKSLEGSTNAAGSQADTSVHETSWSAESVGCIAQLAAARPALQLSF